ncbi:MAG: AAA family ATPase [Xanthomonadales bacterium]|nr:AAA family ATPase [Gammaproteobacteria bacterium]MBT8053981.1 AAA family ATPase [Gammaproteobacteria bacterium]NND58322.1 AAA family ATPase [Xanthomonadales bacterium]NNK51967.1 AAA family ATPase [Xanthomonadales bacterium]
MKTIVINETEETRVPFLRGILIRNLLDVGLSFEDAFGLATRVREDLSEIPEISAAEIRDKTIGYLEEGGHTEALEPYRLSPSAPAKIQVHSLSGTLSAFSRGKHERYLQASGMKTEKAEQTTALIYDQLLASGVTSITTCQLGYLTYLCLRQEVSKKAAKRYLVWSEFQRSGRPLLLLICGTVGTGKSTMATEIAHLLDIVRIQSTDMLREVMRLMMPSRLLPVLHTSSFNAWQALPILDTRERDKDQLVADGYRTQTDLIAVPCEAVLQRAIEESVPLILEGVHAHPDLMSRIPAETDAILAHVTLAVLKPKELKSRLRGRGSQVPQRRAKRYLNKFDSVWSLQSFLLSEADRCDVPIITNNDKEKAVVQVILQVVHELTRHFDGGPENVFGPVVDEFQERAEHLEWNQLVPIICGPKLV